MRAGNFSPALEVGAIEPEGTPPQPPSEKLARVPAAAPPPLPPPASSSFPAPRASASRGRPGGAAPPHRTARSHAPATVSPERTD